MEHLKMSELHVIYNEDKIVIDWETEWFDVHIIAKTWLSVVQILRVLSSVAASVGGVNL